MRLRAFKYRIYPTSSQASAIRKTCGCRRFIYNWGLELKQKAYQQGIRLNVLSIQGKLPEMKEKNPWLKEVNSQSLQVALRDLDIAFTRFFKKIGEYPSFKSKGKSKDSFQVPQHFKIDTKNRFLTLPKLGNVKTVFDRIPDGMAKSVTVSMSRSGKFFASVLCEQDVDDPKPKPVNPDATIGIDMGIRSFVVCSDGRKFDNPKYLGKSLSRLRHLSRQLSKKAKGGKNRERARLRLAVAYEKIANQRKDFIHKVSHQLSNENQVGTICIEDLNVKGMMKNHKLAMAISDCSWGEFFRQLKYKCQWRGIRVIQIGRFEPSSKLCPCGFKNNRLALADREWTCPACGMVHDRDLLAANNIKDFGLVREKAVGTTVTKPGELSCCRGKLRTRKPSHG